MCLIVKVLHLIFCWNTTRGAGVDAESCFILNIYTVSDVTQPLMLP